MTSSEFFPVLLGLLTMGRSEKVPAWKAATPVRSPVVLRRIQVEAEKC